MWIYITFYLFLQNTAMGAITVIQNPYILNVTIGDTARISCHWTRGDVSRVRVQWRKYISSPGEENGTVLCSLLRTMDGNNPEERKNNKIICKMTTNTTILTIEETTKEDAGLYVCEFTIEIPKLMKDTGDGTWLYVQDKGSSNPWFALSGLLIFPLAVLITYIVCRSKKKKSKKIPQRRRQEHVELNQMHHDADEAEEDSSSSNSVQWAVSTLYESFDYFAMKPPDNKAAASSTSNSAQTGTKEEASLTAM
ncbi:hypothetical protein GDO81_000153 [Engystomops pustulosus]|uniref:Ig-like domain-containing protein n=1 Tax=Engystomops pustulosus TaxID=76066 RepID=A0AAV7D3Z8_ENGPU|nr:hypothetical protein GDO81_000153 [Engystomops pustulosus]